MTYERARRLPCGATAARVSARNQPARRQEEQRIYDDSRESTRHHAVSGHGSAGTRPEARAGGCFHHPPGTGRTRFRYARVHPSGCLQGPGRRADPLHPLPGRCGAARTSVRLLQAALWCRPASRPGADLPRFFPGHDGPFLRPARSGRRSHPLQSRLCLLSQLRALCGRGARLDADP